MRCLIIGANGMLGHQLVRSFHRDYEVHGTVRSALSCESLTEWVTPDRIHSGLSLTKPLQAIVRIRELINRLHPVFVVNAAGTVKQRAGAVSSDEMFAVNGSFPHLLSEVCQQTDTRLIHLSTDCVFDGKVGNYSEQDPPTPPDDYGRSKLMGELHHPPAITLRTSIIGLELNGQQGLIEWALEQKGTANGFVNAIFSGLTTIELARVIERVATQWTHLNGLWHISASPISKFALLSKLTQKLGRADVQWLPHMDFHCNRSLDSRRFQVASGYLPPTWDEMLEELADQIVDRELRRTACDHRAA